MNWITEYVRPKINSLFSRREVPENLWTRCPECGTMLFHRELSTNLNVCTACDHHMPIAARERFAALFDAGRWAEIKVPEPIADPLQFRDQKRYPDRLKAAQKNTGARDAMLVGEGEVLRTPMVVAAQEFGFMAGSMGMYVGNALVAAATRAVETRRPLVVFTASGGARMQEGILSLMQMPRTTVAVQIVKEAGLPYITVLTNPTTGGVTASYAMLGDVQIAEPGALICFAGPRVIEQTIREKLPDGFQRAEYLLDHGMLDRVTPRRALRDELAGIARLLMRAPRPVMGDLAPPLSPAPHSPAAQAPAPQAPAPQAPAPHSPAAHTPTPKATVAQATALQSNVPHSPATPEPTPPSAASEPETAAAPPATPPAAPPVPPAGDAFRPA